MTELAHIEIVLNSAVEIPRGVPQFICGDFNALTLEDYSEDELDEVTRVRKIGRWEAPKEKITKIIKGRMGFEDSKVRT
jgi:hypothetical protein